MFFKSAFNFSALPWVCELYDRWGARLFGVKLFSVEK